MVICHQHIVEARSTAPCSCRRAAIVDTSVIFHLGTVPSSSTHRRHRTPAVALDLATSAAACRRRREHVPARWRQWGAQQTEQHSEHPRRCSASSACRGRPTPTKNTTGHPAPASLWRPSSVCRYKHPAYLDFRGAIRAHHTCRPATTCQQARLLCKRWDTNRASRSDGTARLCPSRRQRRFIRVIVKGIKLRGLYSAAGRAAWCVPYLYLIFLCDINYKELLSIYLNWHLTVWLIISLDTIYSFS